MHPLVAENRAYWNHLAEVNWRSTYYDVEGFVRGGGELDPDVRTRLGDVTGRRVLHLQCHFGQDSLCLAREGAAVTGVDFSPVAIGRARELAERCGLVARFVEADVNELHLGEQFDLVFASWGVLGWHPELGPLAATVRRHLAPGGRFVVVDGHPYLWSMGETLPLALAHDYFRGPPITTPPQTGSYADPEAAIPHAEHGWNHSVAELLQALIDAGLAIASVAETERIPWQAFEGMVKDGPYFSLPAGHPRFPLGIAVGAQPR